MTTFQQDGHTELVVFYRYGTAASVLYLAHWVDNRASFRSCLGSSEAEFPFWAPGSCSVYTGAGTQTVNRSRPDRHLWDTGTKPACARPVPLFAIPTTATI